MFLIQKNEPVLNGLEDWKNYMQNRGVRIENDFSYIDKKSINKAKIENNVKKM